MSVASVNVVQMARPEARTRKGALLDRALEQERARRDARRLLDAEERGPIHTPELETLRALLSKPHVETPFRVSGLWPSSGRVLLAAQFKTGKTTFVGNLVRSLIDGDPFLGTFDVVPVFGRVAVLDTEMSLGQLTTWMGAQGIRNDDRVIVESLRGRLSSFALLDKDVRARWAEWLRARRVEVLVLDCLRPMLDALGLDEQREAGRFLVPFDQLLTDAGIAEAAIVHHMGHTGERSRGDSRLRDWPDVEWALVRQDETPRSARFFTAYGRDVDVPETQLDFDVSTRHLTVVGGTRKDAKQFGALGVIVALLAQKPDQSGRDIKKALKGGKHGKHAIDAALHAGEASGRLTVTKGANNSKLYRAVSQCPNVSPECPRDS